MCNWLKFYVSIFFVDWRISFTLFWTCYRNIDSNNNINAKPWIPRDDFDYMKSWTTTHQFNRLSITMRLIFVVPMILSNAKWSCWQKFSISLFTSTLLVIFGHTHMMSLLSILLLSFVVDCRGSLKTLQTFWRFLDCCKKLFILYCSLWQNFQVRSARDVESMRRTFLLMISLMNGSSVLLTFLMGNLRMLKKESSMQPLYVPHAQMWVQVIFQGKEAKYL